MHFSITWTITAVIAVVALISPIIVAVINNKHHTEIRKMELSHDEHLRQLEIYYADKKVAFSEFINAAGAYSSNKGNYDAYAQLQATLNKAILFCNHGNQLLLHSFSEFIDSKAFDRIYNLETRQDYSNTLNSIAQSLNAELESTKPCNNVEDCKSSKH